MTWSDISSKYAWMTDQMTDWMTDSMTDQVTDWMTDLQEIENDRSASHKWAHAIKTYDAVDLCDH